MNALSNHSPSVMLSHLPFSCSSKVWLWDKAIHNICVAYNIKNNISLQLTLTVPVGKMYFHVEHGCDSHRCIFGAAIPPDSFSLFCCTKPSWFVWPRTLCHSVCIVNVCQRPTVSFNNIENMKGIFNIVNRLYSTQSSNDYHEISLHTVNMMLRIIHRDLHT